MYGSQSYDVRTPDVNTRPSISSLDAAELLLLFHRGLRLGPAPRSTQSPFITCSSPTDSSRTSPETTDISLLDATSSDSASTCSSRSSPVLEDLRPFDDERRVTHLRKRSMKPYRHGGTVKSSRAKVPRARKCRKNKTEEERIEEFRREVFVGKILPHAAWCTNCEEWVGLDKRREYYFGMWEKHMKYYHIPGGKGYELAQRIYVQTEKWPQLFKPKRGGDWWQYE